MVIETITEVIQSKTYQRSHCKHCGRQIERTNYANYGSENEEVRYGKWFHSAYEDKAKYRSRECSISGVVVPEYIPNLECEECNKPIKYIMESDDEVDEWVHIETGSWFCNPITAEPE